MGIRSASPNLSVCKVCRDLISCEHSTDIDVDTVHTTLIALLTRHAQTLAQRRTSAAEGDEVGAAVVSELSGVIGMLQGLCLLSERCKEAVGQSWVLEVCDDSGVAIAG